ncbi:MAG TPA: PLP-dependent aminotransferase family protein [Epulopiscium sp.]|nr:PLP-dependent aminotransferase family protein [Candidatus Epulonipiscium sp.]
MKYNISNTAQNAKASEVREILKLTQTPEIISFAGGLPAPDLFPVADIKRVMGEVLDQDGFVALQYTTTEGNDDLRNAIINQRLKPFGMDATLENLMITSGSQQGLELTAKMFINHGDTVIVENPTYLTAISPFKSYGAELATVDTDDDGIIISDLIHTIETNENVKFIYLIPDFQNPTGRCMSLERRKQVVEIAEKYKIPVIEDSPYGELVLSGEKLPTIKSFDKHGYVIYLGSFSKVFCPGFRIGWILADSALIEKYAILKQGVDLQTSTVDQMIVARYMMAYNLDDHIEKIKALYKSRRECMLNAIEQYFPKNVEYTKPRGGLFIWVILPEGHDSKEILKKAIEQKVAFVPGQSFYAHGNVTNTFRLNYSNMPEERIKEGIQRLGAILDAVL